MSQLNFDSVITLVFSPREFETEKSFLAPSEDNRNFSVTVLGIAMFKAVINPAEGPRGEFILLYLSFLISEMQFHRLEYCNHPR